MEQEWWVENPTREALCWAEGSLHYKGGMVQVKRDAPEPGNIVREDFGYGTRAAIIQLEQLANT